MTKTRKVLAYLMAALLALPLFCATAKADDGYTFVIQNENDGYTYLLYQIFKGDSSTNASGEYVLSNIEWGNGVKGDTKEAVYNMFELTGANRTAANVAQKVKDNADNDVFHTILTNLGKNDGSSLDNAIATTKGTYSIDGGTRSVTGYGATGLAPGYYLVRNTVVPDGQAHSDYIVKVVGGDVVAEPKAATPTSSKKVQDVNDSLNATLSAAQDSADYDIGDTIPFTLTATLPTNYANFAAVGYRLIFVDDISAGLSWDGTATIYYGASDTTGTQITFANKTGEEIPTLDGGTIVASSQYSGGKVMAYEIPNLMAASMPEVARALKGGDTITIRYNATLNANATVGKYGNRNGYTLYYSNDPTSWQNVGHTTEDINVVFTYKTVFNKVDEGGNALTGADFMLEKFVADQNGTATTTSSEGGSIKGNWVDVTALHTETGAANPIKTGDATGSTFAFSGLDDGIYKLTETTTPVGYNTIDPIEFTISAEHDASAQEPRLTSLTGTNGTAFVMEPDLDLATLTASIENKPGLVLPTTGALGTKALVAFGSAVLVGSLVVLVTRRRLRME